MYKYLKIDDDFICRKENDESQRMDIVYGCYEYMSDIKNCHLIVFPNNWS